MGRGSVVIRETAKKVDRAIVVNVGDFHTNSTLGLRHPRFTTDDGDDRHASPGQRWLWKQWIKFWSVIEAEKARLDCPVISFFNGELADINKHAKIPHVTLNPVDAIRLAAKTLQPAINISDKYYVCRGTEAHTGEAGYLDELVAADIGAEKHGENYSKWLWWLDIAGVTFDVAHHPGYGSRQKHTRGGGAQRLAESTRRKYQDSGHKPPMVVLRNHNHIFETSGRNHETEAFICDSWKLCDSYGHRIGGGNEVLPVGGMYFICERGEYVARRLSYTPPRDPLVKVYL